MANYDTVTENAPSALESQFTGSRTDRLGLSAADKAPRRELPTIAGTTHRGEMQGLQVARPYGKTKAGMCRSAVSAEDCETSSGGRTSAVTSCDAAHKRLLVETLARMARVVIERARNAPGSASEPAPGASGGQCLATEAQYITRPEERKREVADGS